MIINVYFVTMQNHEGLHDYGFFTDRDKVQAEVDRLEDENDGYDEKWGYHEVYVDLHEGTINVPQNVESAIPDDALASDIDTSHVIAIELKRWVAEHFDPAVEPKSIWPAAITKEWNRLLRLEKYADSQRDRKGA